MKRPRRRAEGEQDSGVRASRLSTAGRIVILITLAVLPVFVLPGKETFRLPKEIMLRAEAILLVTLFGLQALFRRRVNGHRWRQLIPSIAMASAVMLWTLISAVASPTPMLTPSSVIYVAAAILVFTVTAALARELSLRVIALMAVPALINGLVYGFQEHGVWKPFQFEGIVPRHLQSTALLGNPDDLGGYLVGPALAAMVLVIIDKRHRGRYGALAVLLSMFVLMSQSLMAAVALVSGTALLSWLASRRATAALGALFVLILGAAFLYRPVQDRIVEKSQQLASGDYDDFLSHRAIAFYTAVEMFKRHPVFGVGPGCYGWQYYDYKLSVLESRPHLLSSGTRPLNFAETHSDHLQVLAVAGLPGYLIFLAALAMLASLSRGPRMGDMGMARDPRAEFASLLALPLAGAFAMLALAQFPLELAGVLHTFISLAALCVGWRAP
jgi:O-antigen ligase